MGNPILMPLNAGFGETPVPADAALKPGDKIGLHRDGEHVERTVTAVVPAGSNLDYAIADQNGQPRPLMIRSTTYLETIYVIDDGGAELLIGHKALTKARRAADKAGLNTSNE